MTPSNQSQKDVAMVALFAIGSIVLLTLVLNHSQSTGAISGSGMNNPPNQCDRECARTLGLDFKGIGVGQGGWGGYQYCLCKSRGTMYRYDDLWP